MRGHFVHIRIGEEGVTLPFAVVKAQGDKGTYAFNKAATKSVISYLDNMLTPYCECSLLTNGSVSSVTPTVDGTVEKQGDKWLVISKAQVSIS